MFNFQRTSTRIVALLFLTLVAASPWFFVYRQEKTARVEGATALPPVFETAESMVSVCKESPKGREKCYSEAFRDLAYKHDHEFAFTVLFEVQQLDHSSQGCHLIAHAIGWSAYQRDPGRWQELVNALNPTCGYGAIHGVLEKYVGTLPDGQLTAEVIPTLCGERPRADCNHIIGHLVLVNTQGKIDPAVELCGVFKTKPVQYDHCLTGVFMEYQTALNLIEHGYAPESWLDWPSRLDELERICRSYEGESAASCWQEITHAALMKFGNDPKQMFEMCSTAQVVEGAKKCRRHSIGIIAAARQYDLPSLKYVCELPQKNDPTFSADCYDNLIGSTLISAPQANLEASVSFCGSIDAEFRQRCFSQIYFSTQGNPSVSAARREEVCARAPVSFQDACTGRNTGNYKGFVPDAD